MTFPNTWRLLEQSRSQRFLFRIRRAHALNGRFDLFREFWVPLVRQDVTHIAPSTLDFLSGLQEIELGWLGLQRATPQLEGDSARARARVRGIAPQHRPV
ncbi:MAG: hypothetical protein ACRD06_04690 [Terriglobia bacterium]